MTSSPLDPLFELRCALAQADAVDPPARLLDNVTLAAFAGRQPGRSLSEPESISSTATFERAVGSLDELLGSLAQNDWHRPALRRLDVQGLLGHMIGVEHAFQRALDSSSERTGSSDHVKATERYALAQRGRAPVDTMSDWQLAARRSVELLGGRDISEQVSLHGLALPLDALLVVRAFELWTHEEDIRRATDRELAPPDPPSLQRMVNLAVRLLPGTLTSLAEGDPAGVRLVLLGEAGGTFDVQLAPGIDGAAGASIVADTIDFCRLVANRIPSTDVALSVTGDRAFAERVLAGATALALD